MPYNTLAWIASRVAGSRLKIVDVTDIWPDVLPFSRRQLFMFKPLFSLWRYFFNSSAASADVMMTVSDSFYEETLKHVRSSCKCKRFYLGEVKLLREVKKEDVLTIAYSGNLGRLYDFETLLDVMDDAERGSIQLFIVGDGERREWLLSQLRDRELQHQYFGSVYDPQALGDILCRAHLGFNGFINTSASFSTKATTYMSAGLPIINSMGGDLMDLVISNNLGFNYEGGNRISLKECLEQIDEHKLRLMSDNCKQFFAAFLDRAIVRDEIHRFLKKCFEQSA